MLAQQYNRLTVTVIAAGFEDVITILVSVERLKEQARAGPCRAARLMPCSFRTAQRTAKPRSGRYWPPVCASASPGRTVDSTFLPKGRPPRVRDRRPSPESRRR